MSTALLKTEWHQLVDHNGNESLLRTMFDMLHHANNSKKGTLWSSLPKKRKQEILESAEDANSDENLIPWQSLMSKYSCWFL